MHVCCCGQIFKEAQDLMPGGVNSPVRAFRSVGGSPIIFESVKVNALSAPFSSLESPHTSAQQMQRSRPLQTSSAGETSPPCACDGRLCHGMPTCDSVAAGLPLL